jgi:hypothetical protein
MRRALFVACVLALTGCGGGEEAAREPAQNPPPTLPAELLELYDYDASQPFVVEEVKTQEKDGATVHDLSYDGPDGRITAFYVVPEGDGPFPAVLFMPGAPGARYTFFSEAVELAKRGVVSLLPDPPYARPPVEDVVEFKPDDKHGIVQEVVEMRRGIDSLLSPDEVDPSRLGYVGFSWGGSLGAIFSAVERRVGSAVFPGWKRPPPRSICNPCSLTVLVVTRISFVFVTVAVPHCARGCPVHSAPIALPMRRTRACS